MRNEDDDALEIVPSVTRRHGRIFAKLLASEFMPTEAAGEIFGLTGIIEWPQETGDDTPAKLRYERLEAEILRRTLSEAEDAIAEAFVRVAAEVIERERENDAE